MILWTVLYMTDIVLIFVIVGERRQRTKTLEALKKRQNNMNNLANNILYWRVWDGSGRRTRRTRASVAARAQKEETDSDVTSESVLRQKEACREAVEKCRAGRGADIQWGAGSMV